MSKPQVYLNARQQRSWSWKNCRRQYKTWTSGERAQFFQGPDLQDAMRESPAGLRCPGDLTDLQCATSGEEGGCIRSWGGEQALREEEEMWGGAWQPLRNTGWAPGKRKPKLTWKLPEDREEVPLHQQKMKDQIKQALVTKKKNKKEILSNYKTTLFQTLGRKWSRTSLTLFPGISRTRTLLQMTRKISQGTMCQIDPVTYDEATGSVHEESAADTISLTLPGFVTQSCLSTKQTKRNGQDSWKRVWFDTLKTAVDRSKSN